MKISILILAFKNPGQLRKLVDVLKKDFEVYIHFDKTSAIPDSFRESEPHVHVLENRHASYWGSHNTLLAVLELLKAANADGSDYNILISGQDLPIKSNKEIISFITNNYRDYLHHFPLPDNQWGFDGGINRVDLFWETKYNAKNFIEKWMHIPYRGLFAMIRKAQKTLHLKRRIPFDLYGGSFSLNFTKEATNYILNLIAENPWFLRRFKYTRCADEIFFNTLLLAFDYPGKGDIINDDIRFADWKSGPAYPKVLTIDDFERCINATQIFGRKFDEQTDAEIIDKILAHVSR